MNKLMTAHLPGAGTLPFAGFVTRDLKWVAGFSGYKNADEFAAVLDEVENSPILAPSPADAKKLEAIATQAEQAVQKGQWSAVMAAMKASGAVSGRSPVRAKIAAAVAKAREWADTEMTKQVDAVKTGGDHAVVRAALTKISSAFSGEPEQKDADNGAKALAKLGVIEALPPEQQDAAREKASKEFSASRWVAIFDKSVPKPAEKPPEGK